MKGALFKQKILIVDDEPINITLRGQALQNSYDILVATNGIDALRLAQKSPYPDLILLDVMMSDMDGYPQGLSSKEIPLSGRIMAIADVYDTLAMKRIYRAELPHKTAVAIIVEERGKHFDPDLVDAFVNVQDQFRKIAQKYTDNSA